MTVFENVAFGLRVKPRKERATEAAIRQKVHNLLELVQLDWLADRYPSQLSGGQRQRIALARALAVEPRLLLLDEPFGALDAKVRKDLRRWLRRLHDEIHVTSVFVTHDQEEALEVADRIVVLNKGRIEQVGTPDEVYSAPASPFVYSFLGNVNLFHGRAAEGWADIGGLRLPAGDATGTEAAAVAYVRPHDIELSREALEQALTATVLEVRLLGGLVRLVLKHGEEEVEVELSREAYLREAVQVGETVHFRPRQARVFLEEAAGGGADYTI
jgi:sulfate transport system ATP-binding protein